jgi:NitT/TauT family transport system ATP-binding protein
MSAANAHSENPTRRDFIYVATTAFGAVGAAMAAWPLIAQMAPDRSALASGTTEVDLSKVAEGQSITVTWRGKPLAGRPERVGYMLQKDLLLPWRTALGNVQLGMELKNDSPADIQKRSIEMLDKVGLGSFHTYYPSKLSGGMRQRIALARTLVTNPEVLLLDEPFAALDFQTKLLLESDMARLVRSEGRSLLMITHDVEEAVSLSDRVVVLSHRPSCIRDVHTVNLGIDRTDMMAARRAPQFTDLVRLIWSQLEVRGNDD